MSGFAATVAELRAYGDVHEVAGWSALPDDARAALSKRLVDAALAAGLAVAGDLASGRMDFIGDRSRGWPDVRLERSDDDRLALGVCGGTGPGRHALHAVVRALGKSGLSLLGTTSS